MDSEDLSAFDCFVGGMSVGFFWFLASRGLEVVGRGGGTRAGWRLAWGPPGSEGDFVELLTLLVVRDLNRARCWHHLHA